MEHILIEVSHSEIIGKDKLNFDLYNSRGEILHKSGQKLDPGFLLMLKYSKAFKIDEINNNVDEFIREMLLLGVKKKASKIFIEDNEKEVNLSFLIDKSLQDSTILDPSFFPYILNKMRKYTNLEAINEFQERDFFISLFNRQIDLKFCYFPNGKKGKIVLEILDPEQKLIKPLTELGFSKTIVNKINDFLKNKEAVLFIAGDAEVGKETTVTSINEYYSLAENFNVETTEIANVVELIKVIKKIPINKPVAILAQKLVKKLCNSCKQTYKMGREEMNDTFIHDIEAEVILYKAKGCIICNNTGFAGQIPIHEYFEPDEAFFNALGQDPTDKEILELIDSYGFQDFKYDALKKALLGLIVFEEANNLTRLTEIL